ncbi:TolC family protein [Aeromonas fluvialis]|uniref:TolC family protein n=1 Tax=Aeromonas fluvialis TaxID=591962 RepID=UPI000693C25C|nr:TolC family protein [Aeromonas fluvialis]
MVISMPRLGRRSLLAVCLTALALPASGQQADGLQAALQAALSLHPTVSGKQALIKAREYSADAARSQRYPSLSAQAQQSSGDNEDNVTGEDLSNQGSLRARQPLWAFGRIDNSIALADADTDVERVDLLRVQRQLLEQTAVAYASVLGSRERLKVMEASQVAHQSLFDQISRREQGQLASIADVRLAATRLFQTKGRVDRSSDELEIAESDLLALTQVRIPAQVPVATGLLQVSEGDALRQAAMHSSAEVRYKKQEIERAKAGVDQAKTASMPTIYLQAEQFYNQPSYQEDNRVSLVLEGTLEGMGFATRGRTGAAVAQQSAAEDDLAYAVSELDRSVRRLQRSRALQAQLIQVQGESLTELQAVSESYQRQYVAGTKSWLDVLNIQREFTEQQLQYVQAQSDWVIYSLQLAALTGGLDALVNLNTEEL